MKKEVFMAVLCATLFSTAPVFAQQPNPAPKGAQAQQGQPNVAEFDRQLAQVQENMQKMQGQMDEIRQAQDPQVRQKLLQDHWATMQGTMAMMRGMWGPGMMGGPMMGGPMRGRGPMMGWGQMGGYYSRLTPEQIKQRQYMMDQYMGMQQQMMNQMLEYQNMWNQPPR